MRLNLIKRKNSRPLMEKGSSAEFWWRNPHGSSAVFLPGVTASEIYRQPS
jgi:hypothetical protein